jgi:hypothetical protein
MVLYAICPNAVGTYMRQEAGLLFLYVTRGIGLVLCTPGPGLFLTQGRTEPELFLYVKRCRTGPTYSRASSSSFSYFRQKAAFLYVTSSGLILKASCGSAVLDGPTCRLC